MASVEIHVPISPTPAFLNRVHLLAASLELYGRLGDHRIVVNVGADEDPRELALEAPWAARYPIEWRWMPRDLYRSYEYWATRLIRFTHDFSCDVVLILDPDVLCVGPVDELVDEAIRRDAVCGSPSHVSPVREGFTWEELWSGAGLVEPPRYCFEHTGWGLMEWGSGGLRYSPPYFNLGVVALPAHLATTIGSTVLDELSWVASYEPLFRAQCATALTIARHGLPTHLVSLAFNFPNDVRFAERYSAELADMRLCHYLRNEVIDRDVDLVSPEAVDALLARPLDELDVVNRFLVERLADIQTRVRSDLA